VQKEGNVDKNSSANSIQGVTGQAADFEIHPVGTAERLRRLGVIGVRAAELLEEFADELKQSETINGEWPEEDTYNARANYDEWTATAGYLRALCAPAETSVPESKPAFPPDDDVTVYPWPAGDDSQ